MFEGRGNGPMQNLDQKMKQNANILSIYRVDQNKGCSQKTKIGHGGVFLKKKSMTNKIKEFRQGEL